jgi:hypothetical protein
MLYACFYTICLVFRYTSWRFYAISGNNLLTRCHSASSLFSAIFVFLKSYTGNILGIGRNKFLSLILPGSFQRTEEEAEWGHEGPTHQAGAAQALAAPPWCEEPLAAPGPRHLGVRRPGATPDDAPSPIRSLRTENPKGIGEISRTVP